MIKSGSKLAFVKWIQSDSARGQNADSCQQCNDHVSFTKAL